MYRETDVYMKCNHKGCSDTVMTTAKHTVCNNKVPMSNLTSLHEEELTRM